MSLENYHEKPWKNDRGTLSHLSRHPGEPPRPNREIDVASLAAHRKGIHPDSAPPIGSFKVFLLRPSTTINGQATDLIDGSLEGDPSYPQIEDDGTNYFVRADSSGNFTLTGTYYANCNAGAADPVYIEAREGDPGAGNNTAIALLGVFPSTYNCDYDNAHASSIHLLVTDFTNVMAAFGMAPFITYANNSAFDSLSSANTTGSKSAMLTAFDAVNNVVPIYPGTYSGSTATNQLNTLGNVAVACEDTSGSTSSACTSLFSYTTDSNLGFTGTHVPFDTWQTTASMAQDPSQTNVTNEYNLIPPTAPYLPYDTSAPSAWTVPVTGQPTITSISSHSAQKGAHTITIGGANLYDSTQPHSCPIVVVGFQVSPTTVDNGGGSCSSLTNIITVTMPASAGKGAITLYANGMVSNSVYFNVTN